MHWCGCSNLYTNVHTHIFTKIGLYLLYSLFLFIFVFPFFHLNTVKIFSPHYVNSFKISLLRIG